MSIHFGSDIGVSYIVWGEKDVPGYAIESVDDVLFE